MAPRRITDRKELWAGPVNHRGLIGSFFVKLYETQPSQPEEQATSSRVDRLRQHH
jgi:hypothetical protein